MTTDTLHSIQKDRGIMEQIPDGWALATLSHLIAADGVFCDGDWVESKDQDPSGDVRLVQLADVGEGAYRNRSSRYLTSAKGAELGCTFLKPNDVLIARMPDPIGRACIFPGDSKKAVTVVDVCIVRPGTDSVDSKWLQFALNSPQFRGQIEQHVRGTTRKRISRTNLSTLRVRVPPLAEQCRIVEKVEALLACVEAIRGRLEVVANALRFARSVTIRFATRSEHGQRTSLAELGQWVSGSTPSRSREDYWSYGDIPWVSPKDMKRDFLSDSQEHVTRIAIESTNTRLLPAGSVLCVVRGMILAHSFPVAMNRVPVAVNQDIRALIPAPGVDGEFILRAIQARRIELLEKVKESTHGTRRLDSEDLYSLQIELPPESEQRRIARHVAALMALSGTVARRVTNAIARANKLRQSILAKAFAGELVPTEAQLARKENREYERASVLLERITNERKPTPRSRPARKRSRRA